VYYGIVLFNARKDEFAVADHNLTKERAEEALREYRSKGTPAFTFEQPIYHFTDDTESCQACERDVRRAMKR
jgi:predicted deacetylase